MENMGPKQKIILVTGGAGFIGSHLIEQLVKDKNNRVISLDNYFTGHKTNHIAGAQYIKGHTKDVAKHIKVRPDIIYHLGEYSRVATSLYEPTLVWDMNIAGTLGVLEFWRKHKCKLVYAGSSTKFNPAGKNGVAGRDLAPYTWAKAINSELVKNYSRWYNLNYATVYFYNVYGPRERAGQFTGTHGTVIEILKQAYLKNKPLPIRKPGDQTRAFTHVYDTVAGIMLASAKGKNDEYGICAKEVHSLLEVAKMFGSKIKMLPQTKTSRSSDSIDSKKIKALGWRQKHTLKQYIEEIKK
ncbi:MAG: ADP-L-glycero-D-manno-heptose-6-epimerase [Patescibacteria group bacterium]|nr:ADP-L-glycero-D-manno-heptose-6-epimerase [Patescibacteria group bacterium]MDQ5970960.1 ADP-L-glycero-D-manno-heptose-6-epimerase [Patescibacteria group bacterium]